MVFNPSIPKATDLLSISQGQLLSNNGFLNATFSRNHIPLNIATNNGKHTFIEMVNSNPKGAPPTPALSTGVGVEYTKTVATISTPASESCLFFLPDTSGNEYQLTRNITSKFAQFATSTNYPTIRTGQNGGWTFLPGGMLFQYGIYTNSGGGGTDFVRFPVPFTTLVYSVTLQYIRNTSNKDSLYVHDVILTQFGYADSSSGSSFYWMAVGV